MSVTLLSHREVAEDDVELAALVLGAQFVRRAVGLDLALRDDERARAYGVHLLKDVGGDVLAVSQFTLYASTVKGNRPSYIKAAKPDVAIPLYERFLLLLEQELGKNVGRGIFGADMKVELLNDGPVTIIVDSKLKF